MNKKLAKLGQIFFLFFFLTVLVFPFLAQGQPPVPPPPPPFTNPPVPIYDTPSGDIIPCTNKCDFIDFMQLIRNIISKIIWLSVPFATGVIAWAGFKYMTTGIADKKSEAKEMLRKVFIGFVIILAAWLIVTTILKALLSEDFLKAAPLDISLSQLGPKV